MSYSYDRTAAGKVVEIDEIKKQLGATADDMIRIRGELRKLRERLGDIQFDDSGKVYTNNVENPELKWVRDQLRDLDEALSLATKLDHLRNKVLPSLLVKNASE